MSIPHSCVVDTNVATTANGMNSGAPVDCWVASVKALKEVMEKGHVFVDSGGRILIEYRRYLNQAGQPGAGDAFFRWFLTNEWSEQRVTHVEVTEIDGNDIRFVELPDPDPGTFYDRSDRVFLAVAAAHPDHPPILQSFDSKWWGWQRELQKIGVSIHFLCSQAIEAKYKEKMEK
jgi:hypothetical protein